jgi:hypothetical protein
MDMGDGLKIFSAKEKEQAADVYLIVDLHDILSCSFAPCLRLSNQRGLQGHCAANTGAIAKPTSVNIPSPEPISN